jgi:hypothetical protein
MKIASNVPVVLHEAISAMSCHDHELMSSYLLLLLEIVRQKVPHMNQKTQIGYVHREV